MSDRQAEPQQPEEDHKIDEQIAEALACPCVDDLRSGPCGKSFEAAFSCFLRHQAKHKVRRLLLLLLCKEWSSSCYCCNGPLICSLWALHPACTSSRGIAVLSCHLFSSSLSLATFALLSMKVAKASQVAALKDLKHMTAK